MKQQNIISKVSLAILSGLISANAFAYGMGISSFPMPEDKKIISAEPTAILSSGGGVGLQARYTQKLNQVSSFDFGLGVSGGDRSAARVFTGYDYEILPDYGDQPRTAVKAYYENTKEFGVRKNVIGLAPTISKGFSFWGREAFPYLSVPVGISLNGNNKSYETTISANLGLSAIINASEINTEKSVTANAELIAGLKNSFTGFYFGFGYPIE